MRGAGRGCRRECLGYQAALLDFVDHREAAPAVGAALTHLERCRVCERELAATAVVITALHRLWEEANGAEPPADAWPRLRDRVAHPSRPPRWQPGKVAGLLAGAGLVMALMLPLGTRVTQGTGLADGARAAAGSIGGDDAPASVWTSAAPSARASDDATGLPAALTPRLHPPATLRMLSLEQSDSSTGTGAASAPAASTGGSVPMASPDGLHVAPPPRAVPAERQGPPMQIR